MNFYLWLFIIVLWENLIRMGYTISKTNESSIKTPYSSIFEIRIKGNLWDGWAFLGYFSFFIILNYVDFDNLLTYTYIRG